MKVAFLSESPADEYALKVFAGGLLQQEIQAPEPPLRSRPGGWSNAINNIPVILKSLYYNSDAEGFVMVLDSDFTSIHHETHNITGQENEDCRLCKIKRSVEFVLGGLRQQPNRAPFKTAFGLAVPAIEAWYRCGVDGHVTEAIWQTQLLNLGNAPYTKASLKMDCYGTDRPSIPQEQEYITENAERLIDTIPLLETLFPGGFGTMARDIRGWLAPNP